MNLLVEIEGAITSSKKESDSLAKKLQELEDDSLANLIGDFYLALSNFQTAGTEENLAKLFEVYPKLKKEKLYSYLYIIDRIALYKFYYSLRYDLVKERLEKINAYIFEPGLEMEKTILLYGLKPVPHGIDNEEIEKELLSAISQIDTTKWSPIHKELYHSLGRAYLWLDRVPDAKKVWLKAVDKSLQNGDIVSASHFYNDLSVYEQDYILGLNYSEKAIELMNQTGFNIYQEQNWRVNGHHYMNLEQPSNAFESYLKAIKYDQRNKDKSMEAMDYGYAGWSYFKMDTLNNYPQANEYFEKSIALSNLNDLSYGITLRRKGWALEVLGRKNEQAEVLHLLNEYDKRLDCENRISEYWIRNDLRLSAKNETIKTLNVENEIKRIRLNAQKMLAYFSLILCLLSITLLWLVRQRSTILKQLHLKKEDLEIVNKHLRDKNDYIVIQQNELIQSKKQIQDQLRAKLTLLSSNVNTFEKVTKMVNNNEELDLSEKKSFLSVLDYDFNNQIIEDIEYQFQYLNTDFIQNLLEKHSDLTTNNVKLCSYLKMGLSSKEIAALTYTNTSSVKVARSRLRKKLNLDDEDKLFTYLNSLSSEKAYYTA